MIAVTSITQSGIPDKMWQPAFVVLETTYVRLLLLNILIVL